MRTTKKQFKIMATDLKINGGNGWTAAQQAGSRSLMVWKSTVIVNRSEPVPVYAGFDRREGVTVYLT